MHSNCRPAESDTFPLLGQAIPKDGKLCGTLDLRSLSITLWYCAAYILYHSVGTPFAWVSTIATRALRQKYHASSFSTRLQPGPE